MLEVVLKISLREVDQASSILAMQQSHDHQPQPPPNEILLECAHELRRLATVLLKEVRQGHALPSLSSLVAMKPLQSMLFERLTSRFSDNEDDATDSPDQTSTDETEFDTRPMHPGYL